MMADILSILKNYINNITELIALVISICYYQHLRHTFMKWVLPFLLFIFLGELITTYLLYNDSCHFIVSNYYVIGLFESLFYIDIFFQRIDRYYTASLVISGLLLSIIALAYKDMKFRRESYLFVLGEPGFRIAFGMSLLFSGINIVFSQYDFVVKYTMRLYGVKSYNIVARVLCVVLYLRISMAIILCKKQRKILCMRTTKQ
jgi:hypothetical protein